MSGWVEFCGTSYLHSSVAPPKRSLLYLSFNFSLLEGPYTLDPATLNSTAVVVVVVAAAVLASGGGSGAGGFSKHLFLLSMMKQNIERW